MEKPKSPYFNWAANIFENNISNEFFFSKFRNNERKKNNYISKYLSIGRLENYYLFSITQFNIFLKLQFSSVKKFLEDRAQRAGLTI